MDLLKFYKTHLFSVCSGNKVMGKSGLLDCFCYVTNAGSVFTILLRCVLVTKSREIHLVCFGVFFPAAISALSRL